MTVEIDPSDVKFDMYYKDQESQNLETTLRSNPGYAECQVKRIHWTDDGTDPFVILDTREECIALLEVWEVKTLSESEIISYLEVKRARDRRLSDRDAALYGASIALGLASGVFVFFLLFGGMGMELAFMIIPIFILTPIVGIFGIRRYRETLTQKREVDIEATMRDPSFLSMLHRLTQASGIPEFRRKQLMKRIEIIENST